jgi:hypothetical protein
LHDRSESLFAIFERTILRKGMIRTSGNQFSDADRAQTYSVQQQFGGWT